MDIKKIIEDLKEQIRKVDTDNLIDLTNINKEFEDKYEYLYDNQKERFGEEYVKEHIEDIQNLTYNAIYYPKKEQLRDNFQVYSFLNYGLLQKSSGMYSESAKTLYLNDEEAALEKYPKDKFSFDAEGNLFRIVKDFNNPDQNKLLKVEEKHDFYSIGILFDKNTDFVNPKFSMLKIYGNIKDKLRDFSISKIGIGNKIWTDDDSVIHCSLFKVYNTKDIEEKDILKSFDYIPTKFTIKPQDAIKILTEPRTYLMQGLVFIKGHILSIGEGKKSLIFILTNGISEVVQELRVYIPKQEIDFAIGTELIVLGTLFFGENKEIIFNGISMYAPEITKIPKAYHIENDENLNIPISKVDKEAQEDIDKEKKEYESKGNMLV